MDKKISDYDLIEAHGVVIPTHWDENGSIVAIAIFTFDEDEYFVEKNEREKDLRKYLGQAVLVKGIVKKVNKKKMLTVFSLENGRKNL